MSIDLLKELDQEVRRLLIAGSKLAPGDLRLKKLQAALQQVGQTSPVFARVAQSVGMAIDPQEDPSSVKLLELAALLNSIRYTLGRTDTEGERTTLEGTDHFPMTTIPYRRLSPVLVALTTKGQGRFEVIRTAYEEGIFSDYRLLVPAVAALSESFHEISDYLQTCVIPQYGADALPVLQDQLRLDGGKGDARRLQLIHRISGRDELPLYIKAATEGTPDIRTAAIELLGHYPEQEAYVLEQAGERRKEIRAAALLALAAIGTPRASERIYEALASKDREIAVPAIRKSGDSQLIQRVVDFAADVYEQWKSGRKPEALDQLRAALEALSGRAAAGMLPLLRGILSDRDFYTQETIQHQEIAAQLLLDLNTPESLAFAVSLREANGGKLVDYSLWAAVVSLSPAEVYTLYAGYWKTGSKSASKKLTQVFLNLLPTVYQQMTEEEQSDANDVPDLDPRWVQVFVQADELELVCRTARAPDRATVDYLKSKCGPTSGYGSFRTANVYMALFHIGYKDAQELLIASLTPDSYRSFYYLNEQQLFLLKQLPATYADQMVKFAEDNVRYDSVRTQLLEVADFIRTKPAETPANQRGWVKWITSKMF